MAEPDAHLALVALQLGEPEEAKKLFTSAGRPDLLNRLLQACLCTTASQPDCLVLSCLHKKNGVGVQSFTVVWMQHTQA